MNAKKPAAKKAAAKTNIQRKGKTGRPSSFTQAKADAICERLAKGESLRSICVDAAMPDQNSVYRWLRSFEAFRQQYARAREDQAETIFDEMLGIADDSSRDTVTKENDDGSTYETVDHDHIQRSKLRIEARKWVLGKLAPKKYGEKQQIEHSGSVTLESLIAGSADE